MALPVIVTVPACGEPTYWTRTAPFEPTFPLNAAPFGALPVNKALSRESSYTKLTVGHELGDCGTNWVVACQVSARTGEEASTANTTHMRLIILVLLQTSHRNGRANRKTSLNLR